ncbi:sulfite reductase flavoprotein subunit alpha [Variovorax ginsengisoli]|uniref:Sulfite reductase (NADPH) flavoprotein alpha-component n=1 Tax=Variovorax ginsengisoli TaxID=363844 RepID=A0ABT9S3G1_9BURK|nr:sulfite reductase flavoprotein subunit alpha [Variovorax ginsengisoli]MDP9898883.1 sulfite reductase (NADPH) flavoprotein alpha-component [Variovorax ginsengisoli]
MALLRRIWFQIHWFLGITAGSVLLFIGLTGAVLSFREEIVALANPALQHVAAPATNALPLTPAEWVARLQPRRIAAITLYAEAGRPVRINFAPAEGQRRGEVRLADPYTAALLPPPRGEDFFDFVESLHRWLLLPRDIGKPLTGAVACVLLVLALSGLYLRWPRRPLAWRAWLRLDFTLTGRAFLWNLHAVAGTLALLAYLVSSVTGIYWAFDGVRTVIDDAAGENRNTRMQRVQAGAGKPSNAQKTAVGPPDLGAVWTGFLQQTHGNWSLVTLRLPARGAALIETTYLDADPAHERARNRLYLDAVTGRPAQHDRYADKPMAGRLINSIYPLHMGTYWGLPGRLVMTLSSLGLVLFAITGWMLYLGRRRTARAVRTQRAALQAATAGMPPTATVAHDTVLVAYASQTGHAERLALQTAASLQAAGLPTEVRALGTLSVDALHHYRRALLVASTFGEGEPPDTARPFARRLASQPGAALQHLRYGILALGDRHYTAFCGFGHLLEHGLQTLGAQPLFPTVEMDNGDPAALQRWSAAVAEALAVDTLGALQTEPATVADDWTLTRRTLLNPGSQGAPLYELAFSPPRAGMTWAPGAIAELRLAPPLAPRKYSVASTPADGTLQLLVRQARHDNGLGVASGLLTQSAALGNVLSFRLLDNPGFAAADDGLPCVFIGNGSGFAGLRGHLRERVRRGHARNWLLFGEREAAHDAFCADEVAQWQAAGALARVDLVYSRASSGRVYVQDRLREAADELRQWIAEGAIVYVCGSLVGMAGGVDAALRDILGSDAVDELLVLGRYRRDVY